MKNLLNSLLIIALCIISISTNAQDLITKKDGTDISAKVLELTITEIKYKKYDNLSGPIYTLPISDVLMIRYEDGTKDIFNKVVSSDDKSLPDDGMCEKGKEDAIMYYEAKKTGAGWTLVTAAVPVTAPLFGLIPALSCCSAVPADRNLNYPDKELMQNADYSRCYKHQAKKMKKKKIWKFYAIGSGIYAVALIYNVVFVFNKI